MLSKKSSFEDIMKYWKEVEKKHNPEEFTGQLSILDNPFIDNGPYTFADKEYDLRIFVNTNVSRDWYTPSSGMRTEFYHIKDLVPPVVKEGDVIFDCGAHHGVYTALFAKEVGPTGKVYAFELVPVNAELAEINARINDLNNVEVITKGLSSKEGTIYSSPQAHSMKQSHNNDSVKMELTTLDTYAHLNPTMIKLDIEGSEIDALEGAKELLKKKIRWEISLHPPFIKEFGKNPMDVFKYLPLSDYVCYISFYPNKPIAEYKGEFALETFCELTFFPK